MKLDLGSRGVDFVNTRLSQAGAVSRSVLERTSGVSNAFTIFPATHVVNFLPDFRYGQNITLKVSLELFLLEVRERCGFEEKIFLLFEDTWAPFEDASLKERIPATVFGSSLYYVVCDTKEDDLAICASKQIKSFEYNIFVAFSKSSNLAGRMDATETGNIASLIPCIRMVSVSAFDREGLVISLIN